MRYKRNSHNKTHRTSSQKHSTHSTPPTWLVIPLFTGDWDTVCITCGMWPLESMERAEVERCEANWSWGGRRLEWLPCEITIKRYPRMNNMTHTQNMNEIRSNHHIHDSHSESDTSCPARCPANSFSRAVCGRDSPAGGNNSTFSGRDKSRLFPRRCAVVPWSREEWSSWLCISQN